MSETALFMLAVVVVVILTAYFTVGKNAKKKK
jgi:hypothetical protein